MGMTTFSYFEYYLTMLGWAISNSLWSALTASGVALIPIIILFAQSMLDARQKGEINVEAVTKSVESRVWQAYVVILFACIPWPVVNLGEIKVDTTASCGVTQIEHNKTQWGGEFSTIGNVKPHVPVWFNLIHLLSKSITGAAIASIPCDGDIRSTMFEIDNQRIADPNLIEEVAQFTNECYAEARVKLFRDKHVTESWTDVSGLATKWEAGWIGSKIFLETGGYYDSMRALSPQYLFPWKESRDEGLAPGRDGGGYPICKDWWLNKDKGLRKRLAEQIKPGLLERVSSTFRWGESSTDSMIRNLVSPSSMERSKEMGSPFYNMGPSTATGVAGALDWGRELVNNFQTTKKTGPLGSERDKAESKVQAMRAALPMFQAIAYMVLVICIPIVLVLSGYSFKALFQLSLGMFTIHFLTFFWELSRWLDSKMLAGLYMNQGVGAVATRMMPWTDHGAAYWMSDFVLWGSLVVMPALFLIFMGWAGMVATTSFLAAAALGGESAGGSLGNIGAQSGIGLSSKMSSTANKAGGAAIRAGARVASKHPQVKAAKAAANTVRNLR
ncbi:conjugal transfer protein TraG N-terminal domain-containing protein [Thiopseudomonas alkaliphila]|uniref:conjugal transfer protein TraG N-terminal domain-containing protein n=1 Tax=Thiopseudomonas alkaliphila TaxID=1697053 RepID=UPI00069FE625|nr:conjugal transfer protein TraG N-terminal domain-containing protein [Thiopseudomonas alkaliphila]